MTMPPAPYAITRRDDGLLIEWSPPGREPSHVAFWHARGLRLACRCAECVEEMTGRPLVVAARIPADVRPLALALVGAYGVRVTWSDGHATGIYTFEWMLAHCPCAACQAGGAPEPTGNEA